MSSKKIIDQLIENSKPTEAFDRDACLQSTAIAQTHILHNQNDILSRLAKIERDLDLKK